MPDGTTSTASPPKGLLVPAAARATGQSKCLTATAHGDAGPLDLRCGPRADAPVPARSSEAVLEEIHQFDGKALRRVREARGISVAEIVSETNIRTWYIECIETERFDALPALIYLKGFLKQIAVYLGLDPQRVLADYIARYHAAARSSQQQGR